MAAWRRLPLLLPVLAACAAQSAEEATCDAQQGRCGAAAPGVSEHHWPSARGRVGHFSTSPHVGPTNLTAALSWTWHHPGGRFHTIITGGPLIDGERNIYLSTYDGIRKFDEQGRQLWYVQASPVDNPTLWGAALFGSSRNGSVYALDLSTGALRWQVQVADIIGSDIGQVGVQDGVVIANAGGFPDGGCLKVTALNATDGSSLWEYQPDGMLWNFMPVFTGNGSFVFQDQTGGAYHLRLSDGAVLWKAGFKGGFTETWTDGGAALGSNGVVYAVSLRAPSGAMAPDSPGTVEAIQLADGQQLWRVTVPMPPNSWPLVTRMRPDGPLLVVQALGAQAFLPRAVWAWFALLHAAPRGALTGASCGLAWPLLRRSRPGILRALAWAVLGGLLAGVVGATHGYWRPPSALEYPAELRALDAETGEVHWRWSPPLWQGRPDCMGDAEGLWVRVFLGIQAVCVPNPWGSPTIDSAGTIYAPYLDGHIYVIRDTDGDGAIDPRTEVSSFYAGAAFSHPGPALAPGMLAVASCDTLFVFKSPVAADS